MTAVGGWLTRPSHDARDVGVRRVPTGVVGADAVAVALPGNGRVVGVARDVGPLGGEGSRSSCSRAFAPLDVEESLVRRIVLPGELDQIPGERGGQSGWRGRRKGVHDDGTRGRARRTAAIGDRQGRRVGPRSRVHVGGQRSRARGAIPERPCPRCHRSVGVVDPEPSKVTLRGAVPVEGVADMTALTTPETRKHVMKAS